MAAKINKNRYRLITLLYVIFVCLSVLNIPATYLDSNFYAIKTVEYQEKARVEQVNFANRLIAEQKDKLIKDTAKIYLDIQARIHKSYEYMNTFDLMIQKKLAAQNTSVLKEFNSKKKMEEIFLEDSTIYHLQHELFDLVKYLDSKPLQLDKAIKNFVPISEIIPMQSGKPTEWARYLFLHKPTAISYLQIKRIKLLLLDNENIYQNAALRTIGYMPAYYSEKEKKAVLDNSSELPRVIDNQKMMDSAKRVDSASQSQAVAKAEAPKFPVQSDPTFTKASNTDNFDEFIQRIITSLHTENFYVGIPNQVLKEFNYLLGTDFTFEVLPAQSADITRTGFNYAITFHNKGEYTMRFTDKRNGANKLIFSKKVEVYLIPNPMVKLNGNDLTKDIVNVKDLFSSNRLVPYLGLNEIPRFPGKIIGYHVTKISKTEMKTVNNYGEVFGPDASKLIASLQKGDIIMFDNITIVLDDNTTRTPNPLTFKIVE